MAKRSVDMILVQTVLDFASATTETMYKMILQRLILTIFLVTFATRAAVLGKRIGLYVLALLDSIRKGAYHDQ